MECSGGPSAEAEGERGRYRVDSRRTKGHIDPARPSCATFTRRDPPAYIRLQEPPLHARFRGRPVDLSEGAGGSGGDDRRSRARPQPWEGSESVECQVLKVLARHLTLNT